MGQTQNMFKKAIGVVIGVISIFGMILLFGTGCSENKAPAKKTSVVKQKIESKEQNAPPATASTTVAGQEKASQPASEQATEPESAKEVVDMSDLYNPEGKINPFIPLFEEEQVAHVSKEKKKKSRIPMTPLEKIDLSQFKLVGIILAESGNKALVEEATGKGYVIKKGTYIGIHSGRVKEILKDRVIVEEEVESITGKVTVRERELKIQKPPGEV